jgi:hypothetical protein
MVLSKCIWKYRCTFYFDVVEVLAGGALHAVSLMLHCLFNFHTVLVVPFLNLTQTVRQ